MTLFLFLYGFCSRCYQANKKMGGDTEKSGGLHCLPPALAFQPRKYISLFAFLLTIYFTCLMFKPLIMFSFCFSCPYPCVLLTRVTQRGERKSKDPRGKRRGGEGSKIYVLQ
ncbi:hypothetical protein DM02DRAFT_183727 [Periconia macrospinosa]|uniref:Uncharacterized protein n=1 Tax=Periconia macrospinosa TaxID=97972 RepID=A0A2V1D957_9PLEO|nr:hypothetical protein DM02DRAFT_183727 [Periconia macrospinosa]